MAKAVVLSSEDAARKRQADIKVLMGRITEDRGALALKVAEAFDQEDWRVLGYRSWTHYVEDGLGFTRKHGYNLVEKGRAQKLLMDAMIDVEPSHREAKVIAEHPEIIEEVKAVPPPQRSAAYEAALLKQREIGEVRAPILKPSGKGGMRGGDPTEKLRRIMAEVEELARQAEEADEIPPQVQAFFEKLYTISFDFVSV